MHDERLTYTSTAGKHDGTMILKLTGPFTLVNLFLFQDEFRAMRPQVLILDLHETPYMDSAGLGLIMNGYVSAQNQGRKLLLAGVNDRIAALLQMTRVHRILSIFPTVESAEDAL
jgi:anti-sigma B factor antagonist